MIDSSEVLDVLLYKDKNQLNPLPMQYLGSKGRISNWILKLAKENYPNAINFFDLFAGSGSTSISALNNGLIPILNDIQPYSSILLKSIFQTNVDDIDDLIGLLENNNNNTMLLGEGRAFVKQALTQEANFLEGLNPQKNWQLYKEFCDLTFVVSSNNEVGNLRSANKWNLFTKTYTNTYFGVKQCLEIDLIRQLGEQLDEKKKNTLLGSTISILTQSVSGTTHLAQFLKISSERTAKNIIKKRSISIVDEVVNRLKTLKNFTVPSGISVTNLDYTKALESFDSVKNPETIIYADPPYFKEHYSRYYHILDTFYLYDYPELTFNPRLDSITTGRYRTNRIVSEFGLKSKVENAFEKLFAIAFKKNLPVILSYANTSLVKKEKLIEIGEEKGFIPSIYSRELLHSGQGQKRNNIVTEYLFVFKLKG